MSYTPVVGDEIVLASTAAAGPSTSRGLHPITVRQVSDGMVYGTSASGGETIFSYPLSWGWYPIVSATGAAFFTTSVGESNTGTGSINSGSIVNGLLWVPDTYTITFYQVTGMAFHRIAGSASGPGSVLVGAGGIAVYNFNVTDSEGASVGFASFQATGPWLISFLGVQVTISGAPNADDTFTVTAVAQ